MAELLRVVIVNYKTPELVIEAVDSLKAHPSEDAGLSIDVVDNASGDDSAERIRAAHPDITLHLSPENLGFAGGNNLVLRGCRADYVLLLNSDAYVEPGLLDAMIAFLRDNPEAGAVSPQVVNADDGAPQDFPARFPSLGQMIRRALFGPQFPGRGQSAPVPMERLHGACMLLRGRAMAAVGILDEGYFMYDEDVDWCVRARRAGWSLWLLPAVRVRHHGGVSSRRSPVKGRFFTASAAQGLRMQYELRKSRYRLYRKFRSPLEILFLKVLTDCFTLWQAASRLPRWLGHPEERAAIREAWGWSQRILSLNPFGRKKEEDSPI